MNRTLILLTLTATPALAQVSAIPPKVVSPSFDCTKAKPGSIDRVICKDRELSILDRTMAQDYARAQSRLQRQQAMELRDEQRTFIANRNLCMKRKGDRQPCIAFSYESRIQKIGEWIEWSAARDKLDGAK